VYGNVCGNVIGIFFRVVTQVKYWYARIQFEIGMKRIRKEREEHAYFMWIMGRGPNAKV
jgi:hypothetical protein